MRNKNYDGAKRIAIERLRQITHEGYSCTHDDIHAHGELAIAAACYAVETLPHISVLEKRKVGFNTLTWVDAWPFDDAWDKRIQHNRIRHLEIAGALIAAEIDRLLRMDAKEEGK